MRRPGTLPIPPWRALAVYEEAGGCPPANWGRCIAASCMRHISRYSGTIQR
jgi:hypothetical protein